MTENENAPAGLPNEKTTSENEQNSEVSLKAWQLMTEAKIAQAIQDGVLPGGAEATFSGFGKPIEEIDSKVDVELNQLRMQEPADAERIPPAMLLRKKVAEGLLDIMKFPSEDLIADKVAQLNDMIEDTRENLTWGPPVTTVNLDLPTVIMRWKQVQEENKKNQQRS